MAVMMSEVIALRRKKSAPVPPGLNSSLCCSDPSSRPSVPSCLNWLKRRRETLDSLVNIGQSLLLLCAGAQVAACGENIDVSTWSEEVKLHDGSLITLERSARAYRQGFPNASGGRAIDFKLDYEPMHVEWKGDWRRIPVSFEVFDGVAYLALSIRDKQFCSNRPVTDFTAQFLRWSDSHWVDVKLDEFPARTAFTNVSTDFWGSQKEKDFKGLMSWAQKALAWRRRGKAALHRQRILGEIPQDLSDLSERDSKGREMISTPPREVT